MSDGPQPQAPGPFGFGFDLDQILRFVQSEGPLNWDVARQVAAWVALGGTAGDVEEPAVAPAERDLLVELARTAQMHVHQATGLAGGLEVPVQVVGKAEYAATVLEGLRPVLTRLAGQLRRAGDADPMPGPAQAEALAGLVTALAPLLLGVQAGFMVGHLAQHALTRHELPLPLADRPAMQFVAPNIEEFERAWQVPADELRFELALREAVHAALRSVEWVRARLARLGEAYVDAFDVDSRILQERIEALDPSEPASFEAALGNPAELLGAMRSPGQRHAFERLRVTASVLEGYADFVLETLAPPLIPSHGRLREARHRHRVERGEAQRFMEAMLGLELSREDYERGGAFCRGVVERAGTDALRRLWEREELFPTPAELDAPGLWLARIELTDPPAD